LLAYGFECFLLVFCLVWGFFYHREHGGRRGFYLGVSSLVDDLFYPQITWISQILCELPYEFACLMLIYGFALGFFNNHRGCRGFYLGISSLVMIYVIYLQIKPITQISKTKPPQWLCLVPACLRESLFHY
jgi:hypothetical protein